LGDGGRWRENLGPKKSGFEKAGGGIDKNISSIRYLSGVGKPNPSLLCCGKELLCNTQGGRNGGAGQDFAKVPKVN